MKRSTRNPVRTRQEIIEKSAPIFNVHGISGTSMKMLVNATGFQMGGIYRHFDTKMDLAKAAFQYNYEMLVRPNLRIYPDLNPKEQLLKVFESYKKMVFNPKVAGGCPILNTAIEVDDTDEEFRELAKKNTEEIISTIEGILDKGIKEGFFHNSIEPRKEAQFIFASIEGALMICTLTKSLDPISDIFERTLACFDDKIFTDKL
jgi:AcrR family transcriptional regulator